MGMTYTAVFVHAHPDDEALLTAGTMADLVLRGHRVVLVVCTDGAEGLAAEVRRGRDLAAMRRGELEASAHALGVTDVRWLGYGDSGLNAEVVPQPDAPTPLVYAQRSDVVSALAAILREVNADVVIGYDPNGGYGHPDHIAVHEIVYEAAAQAETPRILEATMPRDALAQWARRLRWIKLIFRDFDPTMFDDAFTPSHQITHRVDVRDLIAVKREALQAHASQTRGGGTPRTVAMVLAIPRWLYRRWFGYEYYVERGGSSSLPIAP